MTPNPIAETNDEVPALPISERQSSAWDIRNAPRNYLSLVATQIGSAIFSFAAVWLITRNLGSEGYGGIVAIVAASQVAQVFVNWTSVAVVRFGVDEFVETHLIARTFWIRFSILVVNLVLVLTLSGLWFPYIADWLNLGADSFGLLILHLSATVLWIHMQMGLQGAKMPLAQGVLQMVERLFIFAGLLLLVGTARFSFFWVVACYIAAPVAMTIVAAFQLRKFIFVRCSVDGHFLKKLLVYSLPLFPMTLIGYFSGSYFDAIFITKFLSTKDLGIYSVATQINGMLLQLPTLANALLLPLFVTLSTEGFGEKVKGYFKHVLPSVTLAWGFMCVVGSALGYFLIPTFFGQEFAEAVGPFWILVSSSVVGIPVLLGYAAVTHSSSLTYVGAIASVLSAVANITLNYLLIPVWGTLGCAWATVFAYFISTLIFAILLNREIRVPLSWSLVAILPNLLGALWFSYSGNPYGAFAVGLMSSLTLVVAKRNSITQSISLLKQKLEGG